MRSGVSSTIAYLTDGFHLYERVGHVHNYGLRGGEILLVRDCISEMMRELSPLERAICSPVGRSTF